MSEGWMRYRPRPPCPHCGAELYEKFWDDGWAPTDKMTDKTHVDDDCIKVLRATLNRAIAVACAASNDAEVALREAGLL
jgi:hypothetical protein